MKNTAAYLAQKKIRKATKTHRIAIKLSYILVALFILSVLNLFFAWTGFRSVITLVSFILCVASLTVCVRTWNKLGYIHREYESAKELESSNLQSYLESYGRHRRFSKP